MYSPRMSSVQSNLALAVSPEYPIALTVPFRSGMAWRLSVMGSDVSSAGEVITRSIRVIFASSVKIASEAVSVSGPSDGRHRKLRRP